MRVVVNLRQIEKCTLSGKSRNPSHSLSEYVTCNWLLYELTQSSNKNGRISYRTRAANFAQTHMAKIVRFLSSTTIHPLKQIGFRFYDMLAASKMGNGNAHKIADKIMAL